MLLRNNKISFLPSVLSTARKLKYIQLSGNPIIYPKKTIIEMGTEAMLKYLSLQYQLSDSSKTVLSEDQLIDVSLKQFDDSSNFEGENTKQSKIKQEHSVESIQGNKMPKQLTQNGYSITLPTVNSQKFLEKNQKLKKHCNSNKYVKKNEMKKNDEYFKLIEKQFMEDVWLEQRREILNRREKVIQDKKSLAALKNWRNDYKNEQIMHPNTYYALNLSNIPYDIDLNHVKILTRADIEKDLPDKYRKNSCKKNLVPELRPPKNNFHSQLKEMVDNLQTIKSENYELTPRTERKVIGCRIRKLTNLKNKLVKLKGENEQIL